MQTQKYQIADFEIHWADEMGFGTIQIPNAIGRPVVARVKEEDLAWVLWELERKYPNRTFAPICIRKLLNFQVPRMFSDIGRKIASTVPWQDQHIPNPLAN